MNEVLRALGRALRSLLHVKILILAILPTAFAALFWISLTLHFWPELNVWLAAWLDETSLIRLVRYLARWLFASDAAGFVPLLAKLVIMATTLPLIQATSLLLTALCAMPLMVRHVAARSYPALERRHGGNFMHSAINGVAGSLMFLFLWVVTLPLWFVPGVVFVLPVALSAYLNQRLFCYDAIADHADARELHAILHAHRPARYSLGALGVVHYVPLLGWFAPVLTGLAFIHWGLARIAHMRHLETGPGAQ
jgi:CysZ protein